MAWIKDLAGKAEDLLNQIDKNAALALQHDKKDVSEKITEDVWEAALQSSLKGSPSRRLVGKNVDPFLKQRSLDPLSQKSTGKSIEPLFQHSVGNIVDPLSQHSFGSASNVDDIEAQDFREVSQESEEGDDKFVFSAFSEPTVIENVSKLSIFNEPQSYDRESIPLSEALMTSVAFTDESELFLSGPQSTKSNCNDSLQKRNTVEGELNDCSGEESHFQFQRDIAQKLQKQFTEVEEKLITLEGVFQKPEEISGISQRLHEFTELEPEFDTQKNIELELKDIEQRLQKMKGFEEMKQITKELLTTLRQVAIFNRRMELLSSKLEHCEAARKEALRNEHIARQDAESVNQQFIQYKLRAQRILQEKERALVEIRSDNTDEASGETHKAAESSLLELRQLRRERDLAYEEMSQIEARLQAVHEELLEAERRLEASREVERQLREALDFEKRARKNADAEIHTISEELRNERVNSFMQKNALSREVQNLNTEIIRLQALLSRKETTSSAIDLESRVNSLTQNLVHKQHALEKITAERNAIKLQLEKMDLKHRELLKHIHRSETGDFMSINDTDDAKAQVPSFFVESPFDTGVTRRVKRAYTSLDTVSIRTGVFLRRYPLIRIMVFIYIIVMHLWVMFVLFSHTPSVQGR